MSTVISDPYSLCVLFISGFTTYLFALAIYRLYLCPIACFPGSKITAVTGWYETYLDVVKGGQFTFQIKKWHEQYGPIIRINPIEIHISDPHFYDVAYSSSLSVDKMKMFRDRFGLPTAVQSTVGHELHHHRRLALNPYFSKRSIGDFAPHIQHCAERLSNKLISDYKGTSKVVTLNDAWAAYATDIITFFAFAWSYDFLDYPDFVAPFTNSIKELANSVHFAGHFPWILRSLQSMPDAALGVLNPAMRPVFQFQNEVKSQIMKIINGENEAHKSVAHKTIISSVLASDLPAEEKSLIRLQQEAAGIVGAGIETTKSTLSLASFHILKNPKILRRLRQELEGAYADLNKPPSLPRLERLPYLTAVITEALRLSYGVAQRLPRTAAIPLKYDENYVIPPGTPFSMSSYIQHHSEQIFPASHTFDPDRWLDKPTVTAKDGSDRLLLRYLVPFSKGTRMCLGLHLAWAELYIGLANVFRRVDFELRETSLDAVEMKREFFVPQLDPDSKGVRVIVK